MLIGKGHLNEVQHNEDSRHTRFDDKEITRYLRENGDAFVLEFVAPAGTTILFETQHVHRGKVIERGVRKTMTVYYGKMFEAKYHSTRSCDARVDSGQIARSPQPRQHSA
jgi:hypothetical protein